MEEANGSNGNNNNNGTNGWWRCECVLSHVPLFLCVHISLYVFECESECLSHFMRIANGKNLGMFFCTGEFCAESQSPSPSLVHSPLFPFLLLFVCLLDTVLYEDGDGDDKVF